MVSVSGRVPDFLHKLRLCGDAVRVEITKTDAYDLIGRVVEILPRPVKREIAADVYGTPAERLTRITTGAALRVMGQYSSSAWAGVRGH